MNQTFLPEKKVFNRKSGKSLLIKIAIILLISVSLVLLSYKLPNLLPLTVSLPFIIGFYYMKIKSTSKYTLMNCQTINDILLVDDGKRKKFKAVSIIEIQNTPKDISVKEERENKKIIEKSISPRELQYLHYHLTYLAKYIPNITFEIHVVKNSINLRIILCKTGTKIEEIIHYLKILKKIVEKAFQNSFLGLKFETLKAKQLETAWASIFGGWNNFKFKFIEKNKVVIDKIEEKTFLAILKIKSKPIFNLIKRKSQIDILLRGLLGSNFELNYVISANSMAINDFERQNQMIMKSFSRNISSNDQFIEEEEIKKELVNSRNSGQTGLWNVSGYVVIRSNNEKKLDIDIQNVKELISQIFNSDSSILESSKLKRAFSSIPMRSSLSDSLNLSSEELAILFHLPKHPIPLSSMSNIPIFEIPPERRVSEGIPLGKVLFNDEAIYPFQLTLEDLRMNVFIMGENDMGKSRLAMNILNQLVGKHPNINWTCFDWKGEYIYLSHFIKNHEILELTPGSNFAPVELNMFDPQGSNCEEHAKKVFLIIREVFKDVFTDQSELSSQMESMCKEVLYNVIKQPRLRNLDDFIEELKNYGRYNGYENKTIMESIIILTNSLEKLKQGIINQVINAKKSNIDFDQIIKSKIIFNFSCLLENGARKEEVQLIMNLLLKYIFDKQLAGTVTNSLKHVIVIEESQLLIPVIFREVPETNFIEDIPLILRGVGVNLITLTSDFEISSDIISNSGVNIIFKTPNLSQKLTKFQNLSDTQKNYLMNLPKREAIVTIPNFNFPFHIYTDYFNIERSLPVTNAQALINHKKTCQKIIPKNKEKLPKESFITKNSQAWLKREIELKLENDFLRRGIIGKLPKDDLFDYLCYNRNCFLKIVLPDSIEQCSETLDSFLLTLSESAIERQVNELIIIGPSQKWCENIRMKLNSCNSNRIWIFSSDTDDWEKLSQILNNADTIKQVQY